MPWMQAVAVEHGTELDLAPFIFQQDSAPAQNAGNNFDFLDSENITFWNPLHGLCYLEHAW